ncbi:RDD family protein [Streptomyces sp. ISL-112]|uniref:RDD family protein n=1 Tax=unclassified Streptomyces TaxID=2593676 RepID=UPI001BE5BD22|nr:MULTISPECIES: RDD family protein [unclassified Streptomyces]MBT2427120.1 RDD family protein [Streptomyces sp. ISL-112]MBT2461681.1 RDD family protein [Streptomyces sp. ISL-63]
MSAPTPAPGDDSPREGYYPDPSIPGYVRYWNGASWVPGTSRPAPQQAAPVEETGPIFFDEEDGLPDGSGGADGTRPSGGSTGADRYEAEGEAGSVWQADSARQNGFGGERDRRISWGGPASEPSAAPADPRTPLAQDPTRGALPGMRDGGAPAEEAGARPPTEGTVTIRAVGPQAGAVQPSAVRGTAPRPDPVQPNAGTPQGPQALPAAPAQPLPVPAPAPVPQEVRQGPAQVPAAPAAPSVPTPLTPGPGGGSASWAQQVHQLAQPEQRQQQPTPQPPHQSPHQQPHPLPHQQQQPPFAQSGSGSGAAADQPVVPWKPPAADDPFQQLVRAQAAARPAGLGKRFAARLVDNLVLGTVVGAVAIPLGTQAMDHIDRKITAAKQTGETVTVWLLDSTTGTLLGALVAAFLVLGFLLEALPTAKWGRTLGKKLFGLDVRDIESHDAPTLGAALRRWLVYGVLGLLVIGVANVLWCLIDRPWRQCWHDKAARTFVAG